MTTPQLILASQSESRRRMLNAAGIPHHAIRSPLDEDVAKAALRASGKTGADLALSLAEAKAFAVFNGEIGGDALVLGCDQVLVTHDGTTLDKAESLDELAAQLRFPFRPVTPTDQCSSDPGRAGRCLVCG